MRQEVAPVEIIITNWLGQTVYRSFMDSGEETVDMPFSVYLADNVKISNTGGKIEYHRLVKLKYKKKQES